MKEPKNIDRLFQEQFKDFEVVPPLESWTRLEKELNQKKKRRVIPLWWWFSEIAAVLIIGGLAFYAAQNDSFSKENSKEPLNLETNNIVIAPSENSKNSNTSIDSFTQNNAKESNIVFSKPINTKSGFAKSDSKQNKFKPNQTKQPDNEAVFSEKNENAINTKPFELIVYSDTPSKSDSSQNLVTTTEKQNIPITLEELLNTNEKEEKPKTESKSNRWHVTPSFAPVYLGSSSNGSPIDSEFNNNPKELKNTTSVGIGIAYEISPKLKIRSGLHQINFDYLTNNVAFYPGLDSRLMSTVNYNTQGATIIVQDAVANFSSINTTLEGSLEQRIGYLEVPLEISYQILDQKFGVQVISGLSTLFLQNNEILVVSDGFSAALGKANNLNTIHFTSNLGLGMHYQFNRSFRATFEPTLKYQINPFSRNDGGFRPYFIGLYSGISYRF